MMKKLREDGIEIGRYRTRYMMHRQHLEVHQRVAYKVTTQRKHSDAVADDLLNRNFNPIAPNHVRAGDITYCARADVAYYVRYYNRDRLHAANYNMSPILYEMSKQNVSGISCPEHSPL